MGVLYQMIYISSATNLMSDDELSGMLKKSRKKNHQRAITGLLIYADGNFFGVLEGPEDKVKPLMDKIRIDRRHRNVQILWSKPKDKRDFPEYQLAYKQSSLGELSDKFPRLSKIIDHPNMAEDDIRFLSKELQVLVKSFLKTTIRYPNNYV